MIGHGLSIAKILVIHNINSMTGFHSHITYRRNYQENKNKEMSLDFTTTVVIDNISGNNSSRTEEKLFRDLRNKNEYSNN